MSYAWMLVPILPILLGIVLAVLFIRIVLSSLPKLQNMGPTEAAAQLFVQVFALYGFAIISVYVILLVGALALYYLIDRRNAHFRRQQQLFTTLGTYLSTRSSAPVSESSLKMSQLAEDSVFEEPDRPAGLWALLYLFVTPIVGIVVAYNLTQDLRKHNERQSDYLQSLLSAFGETGTTPPVIGPYKPRTREPILYVILTAITGGIFWIYWFYTLLKDYNDHFVAQAGVEDLILACLKPKQTTSVCPACSGSVPENSRFCPSCGRPLQM